MASIDRNKQVDKRLRKELEFFKKSLERFLENHEDMYVLVKGNKDWGFFKTGMKAIEEGYRRFGNKPFLVKKVASVEKPITLTSIRFKKK